MERLGLSGPRGIRGSQTAQVRKRGGSSRVRRAETMVEGERRGGRSGGARPKGEEIRAGSEGPRWRTQGRGGRGVQGGKTMKETERLGGRGAQGAQTAQVRKRGGPSSIQRAEMMREGERREVRGGETAGRGWEGMGGGMRVRRHTRGREGVQA